MHGIISDGTPVTISEEIRERITKDIHGGFFEETKIIIFTELLKKIFENIKKFF